MPLVSILIPAHNSPFFAAALQSALAQTFADIEIIVSDDSIDALAEQATVAAAKADSRVRYVRNSPGLGFHGNFSQCYRLAEGRYLKFLNHDDQLHADCIARMVDAFEQWGTALSMVVARRARIDRHGRVLPDDVETAPIARRNGVFRGKMLGNHCLTSSANVIGEPSAVMFRKNDVAPNPASLFCLFEREYTCLADLSLWLRLLTKGDAYYLAEPLCAYRVHDGQLQSAAPVRTLCRTERFYLPRDARRLGFLQDPAVYRRVLDRSRQHIAWAAAYPGATGEEQALCAAAMQELGAELARLGAGG